MNCEGEAGGRSLSRLSSAVMTGVIESRSYLSMVKLILRDKEYEVKPGMTLLSSLEKCDILPESVIATRDGEMILEDEILKDGDVVKLVAVISGGA